MHLVEYRKPNVAWGGRRVRNGLLSPLCDLTGANQCDFESIPLPGNNGDTKISLGGAPNKVLVNLYSILHTHSPSQTNT